MTGWAVNSIAKAIKGSSPFLPISTYKFVYIYIYIMFIVYYIISFYTINPSAGIGRQDNLKIYWYLS